MKNKYILILDVGEEEIFYFGTIKDILDFLHIKVFEDIKNNPWVSSIYKIGEVLYEQNS